MDSLLQDLRYGARLLARSRGFAVVAILTLALGIAAVTVIFSMVDAFLLRPLPFAEPEALVHVWQTDRGQGLTEGRVSVPNFLDWKRESAVFDGLGGYFYSSYNLSTDEQPIRVLGGLLTPDLLEVLGVGPALGRAFTAEEARPGSDRVVLLSHGLWQRQFGGRDDAIGRTLTLDGEKYEVLGVMPPEFVFPLQAAQFWLPLALDPWLERRELDGPLLVVGRLKAGATREQAQSELDTMMAALAKEYPQDNAGKGANVVPLRAALVFFYDMIQITFVALFLAVCFLLLIVCANLGNLLLARASGRTREVAIRSALGGGRSRIIRQLLTESALLALLGGAAGALLAGWSAGLIGGTVPEDIYRVGEVRVDWAALLFALAVALVASLLFGLAPALQASKTDLTSALKAGERGAAGGRGGGRLRGALVVIEVALAMVLLAGAALTVQSLLRLQRAETGFDPDRVLTMELILPESKYPGDTEENLFYEETLRRVRALPGVVAAAQVYPLPLNFESFSLEFLVEGRAPEAPGRNLSAGNFWVTTDTFETLHIPLQRGRVFSARDDTQAAPVVVINQKLAERFWPGADPIGRALRLEPGTEDERLATVVGVVADSKQFLMNEEPQALIYLPQLQDSTRRRFLALRTAAEPLALAAAARQAIWSVDRDLPITALRTMHQVVGESLLPWSGGTIGLAVLGLGALLLAALGIYGVVAYSVSQRTHELGIRIALGAGRRDILKLVLRQGAILAGIGALLGLVAAAGLTRLIEALLYGVGALDPWTFVALPLTLLAVALLASYVPARRATRVDPMIALRYE